VPSVLEILLHPDRRRPDPAPVRADLRHVILGGMVLWALAAGVTGGLWAAGLVAANVLWTCVAGVALGVVGLLWDRRHRRHEAA
jgi:hypothetical protein